MPQIFTVDPTHSRVSFTFNHLGFSNPLVQLGQISGTLIVDQVDWTRSSVNVTMPLAGLHTGTDKFDAHLKSADFFDFAKFPDLTFKSTKVTKIDVDTLTIAGDLTAHGITRPVTLHTHVNKIGENALISTQTAGFDADAELKRSDFGMDKFLPAINDVVPVHITLSADLAK